jgi:hypothetical protein
MKPRNKFFLTLGICIAVIVLAFYATSSVSKMTGKTIITGASINSNEAEALAKCLTEKGAKMYGAYWCGHCQNQKQMFGSAFQHIDYIECDSSGENANPVACDEAGIRGYPTWVINGQQYPGEQSFDKLKELTGC